MSEAHVDYNQLVLKLATSRWPESQAVHHAIEQGGKAGISAMKQAFAHADWRVRRQCAAFMDHHADQTCVKLLKLALKDSNQIVRRNAIHSLSCDRCKPVPLNFDPIPLLLDAAQNDRSNNVRRTALTLLQIKKPDARVIPVMQTILSVETSPKLRKHAQIALERHQVAATA